MCIDGSIFAKLKVQTTTFNHGKVNGNMDVNKQTSYDLRKAIRGKTTVQGQSGVAIQWLRHETLWQGCQITDFKRKASQVADTDASLLYKLKNTFLALRKTTLSHRQTYSISPYPSLLSPLVSRWSPEWRRGLRPRISVFEASLQTPWFESRLCHNRL
jgi:hypothetical protein